MDKQTQIELEAAAFRRLVAHLDQNKAVQNIDLMNLAGFCRTAWPNGTLRRRKNAATRSIRRRLESISMACLTPIGKPYTRARPQTRAQQPSRQIVAEIKHDRAMGQER